MMTDVEHALKSCVREIDYYSEIITDWQRSFLDDQLYALEWSDKTFEAAANKSALLLIMKMLKRIGTQDGFTVSDYNNWLRDNTSRMVREGLESSSTSVTHNLAKKKTGSAWYKFGTDDGWNRCYLIKE